MARGKCAPLQAAVVHGGAEAAPGVGLYTHTRGLWAQRNASTFPSSA